MTNQEASGKFIDCVGYAAWCVFILAAHKSYINNATKIDLMRNILTFIYSEKKY